MSTDSLTGSTGEPARQQLEVRHGTVGTAGVAFCVNSPAALLTAMAGGAPVPMLLGNGSGIPAA